jgi:hypothetical protein
LGKNVIITNNVRLTLDFSDFFPVVFGFLKRLPIIGPILSHPALSRVSKEE